MILRPWSAVRLAVLALACALLPASAGASLTGLGEAKDSVPELTTALPRELPGPCEGELCGEREGVWVETRVRGFELDLSCRLGGEQGLSCAPRRAYGVEYGERASDRSVFTGHYFDTETSLYYAKARYFDPELGRFLSQDSYLGELTEPPSLHRYLYAFDNPIRYYDPTGNETEFTQLSRMDAEIKRQEKERDWCSANPDACAAKAAATAEADRVAMVRTLGMVQALGGVAQVGLGAAALGTPEPTGVTKVAGWVAVVRGFDNALTGVRQVFSGQVEEPVTQTAVRKGLEQAGTSQETARTASEWTGVVADAASTAQVGKALTPVVPRPPAPEELPPAQVGSAYKERLDQTPRTGGWWSGARGEGTFYPYDSSATFRGGGVMYGDARPNFGPLTVEEVEISGMSTSRSRNFSKADRALAEKLGVKPAEIRRLREEQRLTWHETEDLKTMQLVPTRVNDLGHLGGIAELKRGAKAAGASQ